MNSLQAIMQIMIIKSNDGLKVAEPIYIKSLLPIKTVVGHCSHSLVSNAEFFFQKAIDGLKQLIRECFHFGPSVLV